MTGEEHARKTAMAGEKMALPQETLDGGRPRPGSLALPSRVEEVFGEFRTCEFSTLEPAGVRDRRAERHGPGRVPLQCRCRSQQDPSAGVLRLDLAAGEVVQPGPASLLYHSHDEELWNLKIFLLRGRIEGVGGERVFRPERVIGGSGLRSVARTLTGARKATTAYLKKRGLARPRIPWSEIDAVKDGG